MKVVDLKKLGRSLEIDQDYELKKIDAGSLIMIHLRNQSYPYEVHDSNEEIIIAFQGSFSIETKTESLIVPEGHMVTIPKGVEHRFGAESNAVVLVAFG